MESQNSEEILAKAIGSVELQENELQSSSSTQTETTKNTSMAAPTTAISTTSNGTSSGKEFYGKAQKYWSEIPATVNGMLGGLGHISTIDVKGSTQFLKELKLPGQQYALDCGAGIGRVSKNLLMPLFAKVDLVEQDEHFAKTAKDYCKSDKLGKIYNMGLQKFTPEEGKYDLIWSQWVLGHLPDNDLLEFFIRVKSGLAKGGYFVMKDNVTTSGKVEPDEEDSSVTRPLSTFETILRNSGFKIVRALKQQGFPKGLYPVYMLACRPAT